MANNTSRAKFRVLTVLKTGKHCGTATLRAVHSSEINTEDHRFQTSTPSGTLEISLSGAGTQVDFFQPEDEFYLDFTKVEKD